MKKLLLVLFAFSCINCSYAQIFEQNFQSSTDRLDYIGNSTNQFDWLSSFGNAPSNIVTESGNNFLRFNKTGSSSSVITRRTNLNANATKNIAVIKFKLRITPPDVEETTPPNNLITFYLGGGNPIPTAFDNDNVSTVPDANTFSSLLLRVQKVSSSQYQFFVSSTTTYFEGWQDVLYIANKSGGSITYKNPLGTNSTLATGRQTIWIGTNQVIGSGTISANYTQTTFNQLKIIIPSNYANIKFDIDDFSIHENLNVLPVTFTSFSGKKLGSSAQLSWATISESNNAHFNILRAGENRQFNKIGEVKGHTNTSSTINYSFSDFNPALANNYYKLQQVDLDGTVNEHKEIVALAFNKKGVKISANVIANSSVNIYINEAKAGKANLSIADINGKIVASKALVLTDGNHQLKLDTPLSKGVYIATLQSTAGKTSIKFIN